MKIQHLFAVILLSLAAITPLSATETTEPAFLIDANGRLVLSEAVVIDDSAYIAASAFSGVLDTGISPIAVGACNGGTCRTSDGDTLSCPSSGGPSCNSGQSCVCTCRVNDDGSAFAVNRCVPRIRTMPIGDPVI
ncbi:MAG: hypothetical protein ACPGJE_03600, partial [Wenzhouxiangellaceae bacterium]